MVDDLHVKLLNYLFMRKEQLERVKIAETGLDLVGEAIDIARLAGQMGEIDSMIKFFTNLPPKKDNIVDDLGDIRA